MVITTDPLNQSIITKLKANNTKLDTIGTDTRLHSLSGSVAGSTGNSTLIDTTLTASTIYLITGLTVYNTDTNPNIISIGDENVTVPLTGTAIFQVTAGAAFYQFPGGLVVPASGRIVVRLTTVATTGTTYGYLTYKVAR